MFIEAIYREMSGSTAAGSSQRSAR
jgi:hypothetical protein